MKIAVLSDIHDNVLNLKKAIKIIKTNKCKAILFCGDLCTTYTGKILTDTGIEVYVTLGNADNDPWQIIGKKKGKINFAPKDQDFSEINLYKRKIAFCHYPSLARTLYQTEYYDAVFYGHSHYFSYEEKNGRIFANPGAVCGIKSGKPDIATFLIYDTRENSIKMSRI